MPEVATPADGPVNGPSPKARTPRHVALFLDTLHGGGVQRSMITLARELLARGHEIDLVVCRLSGDFTDHLPAGAKIVELKTASRLQTRMTALRADPGAFIPMIRPFLLPRKTSEWLQSLPSLAEYLRAATPDVLFAATPFVNLAAIWGRRIAGVSTRVIVSERTSVRATLLGGHRWEQKYLLPLLARTYTQADAVVSVSKALADEFADAVDFPRDRITTIYNPVVGPEIAALREEPVDHPWLAPDQPPVVIGLGRLNEQKDYPTLIRAFARLRAERPARLIILGSGRHERDERRQRAELERIIAETGVVDDVDLPGFVPNPFAWLARAKLFVLSSLYEGLPGVLIQALACGCPVVSTDCPTGPREILQSGRFGPLVPVGDPEAMAEAMGIVLDSPPPARILEARAADFSVKASIDKYEALMFDALPEPDALRPAA